MNKTLALLMRVIGTAIVLVMATAASKHVAAGMAKHVRTGLQVEAVTGEPTFTHAGRLLGRVDHAPQSGL